MKTLILYATKHGAAKEIAERIAALIPGSTVCDLKSNDIPPVTQYDCIILGASLYAGSIQKEAKEFLSNDAEVLRGKRLGLYLSGMDASREKEFFEANFPTVILQAAVAKSFLGGIFDPKKAGFLERLIMKAVAQQSGYSNTISDDKVELFTEALKR